MATIAKPPAADASEIEKGLQLLIEPGCVHELRALDVADGNGWTTTVSGYFDNLELMAKEVAKLSGNAVGVYISLNPVMPGLLARCSNRTKRAKKDDGTKDHEAVCRRWLFVDLDPVRPSGISSTHEEHEAAAERAWKLRQWLMEEWNWPEPVIMDSGNGAYLLFRLALDANDAARDLVERVLKALAQRFGDAQVEIDVTTFNAGRIVRVAGSLNRKGDHTTDRPHRCAKLIEIPSAFETVSREQLEQIAREAPGSGVKTGKAASTDSGRSAGMSQELKQVFAALNQRQITASEAKRYKDEGWQYFLSACLFHPAHSGGTSVSIIEFDRGYKLYSCLHEPACRDNGQSKRSWGEVLERLELAEPVSGKAGPDEAGSNGAAANDSQAAAEPPGGELPPIEAGDLAELLDDLGRFISRFLKLSAAQADVGALWLVHTHAIAAADFTPYLNINSAVLRSGKTRLMEVLGLVAYNPAMTAGISASALVRLVDKYHPTLFFDETDAAFHAKGDRGEALRGTLNGGFERGGVYIMNVPHGNEWQPRAFQTFGAKALAGIGKLPPTIEDRSIPMTMQRKKRSEQVERLRKRKVKPEGEQLRLRIERWVKPNLEKLRELEPPLPEELDDRKRDVCEPLLAIADLAGGGWPQRARTALVLLCRGEVPDDESGLQLLADARDIFSGSGKDRISTFDFRQCLQALEDDSPWNEFDHGRLISAYQLSKLLKPFGVRPRDIRFADGVQKGYLRADFEDPWERYLPPLPSPPTPPTPLPPLPRLPPPPFSDQSPLEPLQTSTDAGFRASGEARQGVHVAGPKSEESPVFTRVVADVATLASNMGRGRLRSPGQRMEFRFPNPPEVCSQGQAGSNPARGATLVPRKAGGGRAATATSCCANLASTDNVSDHPQVQPGRGNNEMTYEQLRSMIDTNAAAGKYPQGWDENNKMIWSDRPQPCCLCGGPVATYFDHAEVYGAPACGVCCAMESSTGGSEYWLNVESDPEIAHVNGDDKEIEDDAE